MNYFFLLIMIFGAIFWSSSVVAEIYRCVEAGEVTYQSDPCPAERQARSREGAFDGWIFGETIADVKRSARSRQLPMLPGSSSHLSTYNAQALNRNPEARIYTYRKRIFDKPTRVTLFFTQLSQKLYKIEVSFNVISISVEERKYFYESLYSQLTEKYGTAKNVRIRQNNVPGGIITEWLTRPMADALIGSNLVWRAAPDNQILLSHRKDYHAMHAYTLVYLHDTLSSRNDQEVSSEIEGRTNRLLQQDKDRL